MVGLVDGAEWAQGTGHMLHANSSDAVVSIPTATATVAGQKVIRSVGRGRGQQRNSTGYPCDMVVGAATATADYGTGEWQRRGRPDPSRQLLRVMHGVMCPHSNQWATFFFSTRGSSASGGGGGASLGDWQRVSASKCNKWP